VVAVHTQSMQLEDVTPSHKVIQIKCTIMIEIRRDRTPEIKTAVSCLPSWSLLVPQMITMEQDGSSDIRIVTVTSKET